MGRTPILVTGFFLLGGLAGLLVGTGIDSGNVDSVTEGGAVARSVESAVGKTKAAQGGRHKQPAVEKKVRTNSAASAAASTLERLIASEPVPEVQGEGKITGWVTTASGEPVAGAQISAYANHMASEPLLTERRGGALERRELARRIRETIRKERWRAESFREATTDSKGRYELTGLAEVAYEVSAFRPGFRIAGVPAYASRAARAGEQLNFVATAVVPLEVTVALADGSAPSKCLIRVEQKHRDESGWQPDAHHLVLLRGATWTPESREIELAPGKYLLHAVTSEGDFSRQHEVWIYTTSYRWPRLLKASFWLKGVRIRRVVNEREHRRAMAAFEPDCRPSKHPRHFGIDVHVDDSVGVLEEGRRLGFEVIQVDPDDPDWVHTVTRGIRRSLARAS